MSQYVPLQLRREVRQRAGQHCEYCLLHEDDALLPHEPDHIIAVKHGGETSAGNLAWTCLLCNRAKGSDVASIDPPEALAQSAEAASHARSVQPSAGCQNILNAVPELTDRAGGIRKSARRPASSLKFRFSSPSPLFFKNAFHCIDFSWSWLNSSVSASGSEDGILVFLRSNVAWIARRTSSPSNSNYLQNVKRSKKSFIRLLAMPSITIA